VSGYTERSATESPLMRQRCSEHPYLRELASFPVRGTNPGEGGAGWFG